MSSPVEVLRSAVPKPIWAVGVSARDHARYKMIQLVAARSRPGLIVTVSPHDDMMHFAEPAHYLRVGAEALELVERALLLSGAGGPERILDLPCGYGRVLRHVRARWPDAYVVASDINGEGVDFCAKTFGAKPVYSVAPLSSAPIAEVFDLIWCGSLLTHFNDDRWHDALSFLSARLSPQGTLVFTTHGIVSERVLAGDPVMRARYPTINHNYGLKDEQVQQVVSGYRARRFGFGRYPGGDDEYGISLATPDWITDAATKAGLVVLDHFRQGWDRHQDVWTCTKAPED